MDESYKQNISLIRKQKRFNKQIKNPSNQINSVFVVELISINKINSEDKLNLPTRKQRLKNIYQHILLIKIHQLISCLIFLLFN